MAEAIGVALAVAPLVIAAADHYLTAAKYIERYRLFKSKREELTMKIQVQHAIFQKAIKRLLAYDIDLGDDEASQMLKDANHPGWSRKETEAYFFARKNDFNDEILGSIRLINNELAVLKIEHVTSTSVHQKIKFAVSQAKLEKAVDNLRNLTQDFCTLLEQTVPLRQRTMITRASNTSTSRVAKCAAVQVAASNLYEALGHACTKHSTHQAHLSLKAAYQDSSQVRFTIAFQQTIPSIDSGGHCKIEGSPSWLTVESRISGTIQSTGCNNLLAQLQATAKRPAEEVAVPVSARKPQKMVKKSVKFNLTVEHTSEVLIQSSTCMPDEPLAPSVQNLCRHNNFCNQLQNFLGQPLSGLQTYIGYLESSEHSRHLVYLHSKGQSISSTTPKLPLRSLREVYTYVQKMKHPGIFIARHQRVMLAKELATGVLQFHETPWLTNSICSADVLLPGGDEITSIRTEANQEAYLDVSIKASKGPLEKQTTNKTLIRNPLLFSLGVILLELAYQAPLQSFQISRDVDDQVPSNTAYNTAGRERYAAEKIFGKAYTEVVRKCIECDFGHGVDLRETRLQEAFHQDVICELERLEEKLRKFELV